MALFTIVSKKAQKIVSRKVKLESDIQSLFEENLEEILDIYFLYHEFPTSFGGRIDTLGIDKNGSPVIIEYKRSQSDSVINQGLSYLLWLLDHKAEFEKLVSTKLSQLYKSPVVTYNGKLVTDKFIDWESPRVICISENYNKFDLDTAEILPIKIELLRFQMYERNILQVEPVIQQRTRVSSTKGLNKQVASKSIEDYSVESHLGVASENIKHIFETLKEKIVTLDSAISEEAKAKYIAYKLTRNFVDIVVLKDSLKIFLNMRSGSLKDAYNLARDLTKPKKVGHWGNGDYEVKLDDSKSIEKVFDLVKQSYNYNK